MRVRERMEPMKHAIGCGDGSGQDRRQDRRQDLMADTVARSVFELFYGTEGDSRGDYVTSWKTCLLIGI